MTNLSPTSLVTGGAGFIGSHVAQHCLTLGHRVIVLDDLSGGFEDHVPKDALFIRGSVTDSELVARVFQSHKIDYVYHLAAYAAEGLSHFIRRFNYENNLVGTINLINASVRHKVRCFVFTSSIAVYGANAVPMTEETTPQPEDPYAISKYAAELDLRAAHEMFGLPYIVFRPHNVYGAHQNLGDPYRNVIGIFMKQILAKEPLTIFGDGQQTRAFSHIDDVAPIIASSIECPEAYCEVFNVGADRPYTVNLLADVVCNAFGTDPGRRYLPSRTEVLHAYASHDKVRRILAAGPPVALEAGVAQMAKWATAVGVRSGKVFTDVEISDHMPPTWADMLQSPERLRP